MFSDFGFHQLRSYALERASNLLTKYCCIPGLPWRSSWKMAMKSTCACVAVKYQLLSCLSVHNFTKMAKLENLIIIHPKISFDGIPY